MCSREMAYDFYENELKTLIQPKGLVYILINVSRGLHCAWLVPRTRASSERRAWDYFLASWVRRDSPARKLNVRTVCFGFQAGIDYGMLELVSNDPVYGSGLCPLSLSWHTKYKKNRHISLCILVFMFDVTLSLVYAATVYPAHKIMYKPLSKRMINDDQLKENYRKNKKCGESIKLHSRDS
ncbi:hypothetical protein M9H77_07754 [Catharanthus roseus]|uniref:Uncharacterized protein n=1 Tax=Catharanthus roseus TaxID=4058 RepID=A0ACC0BVU3_CATRO|nr:hypothetical protein M9H77_07754 [Catharanthus roseus]